MESDSSNFLVTSWGIKPGQPDADGDVFTKEALEELTDPPDYYPVFSSSGFVIPDDFFGTFGQARERIKAGERFRMTPALTYVDYSVAYDCPHCGKRTTGKRTLEQEEDEPRLCTECHRSLGGAEPAGFNVHKARLVEVILSPK